MSDNWISVDEEMPEIGNEVLIRIPVAGYFNIENAKYKGEGVFIGAWCSNRGKDCGYTVSHWQPPLTPPETKS